MFLLKTYILPIRVSKLKISSHRSACEETGFADPGRAEAEVLLRKTRAGILLVPPGLRVCMALLTLSLGRKAGELADCKIPPHESTQAVTVILFLVE